MKNEIQYRETYAAQAQALTDDELQAAIISEKAVSIDPEYCEETRRRAALVAMTYTQVLENRIFSKSREKAVVPRYRQTG